MSNSTIPSQKSTTQSSKNRSAKKSFSKKIPIFEETPNAEENDKKMKNEPNRPNDSIDATSEDLAKNIQQENEELLHELEDEANDLKKEGDRVAKHSRTRTVQISEVELKKLRDELAEAKDLGLRSLAELENFRNRSNRILQDERKYASMDLARAILPVWDNMGRALEAAEKDLDPQTIVEGLRMMYTDFLNILQKNHIEKIDALHQPFDPNFHESIAMIPDAEHPVNSVIAETQPGFKLFERVVRPAQVVLAAPVPASTKTPASDENLGEKVS